jgi:hypothetical protein
MKRTLLSVFADEALSILSPFLYGPPKDPLTPIILHIRVGIMPFMTPWSVFDGRS